MKNSDEKNLKTNAVLSVIRQFAAIMFPLITFPYISRILGTENYGSINFSASIISYISLIAGLGINSYAIREGSRRKEDRTELLKFIKEIFTLNCLALAVAYIVLFIVIICIDAPRYKVLLLIQGITVLFNVIGCEWLNVIYEDYWFITIRYIVFQLISVVLMFAFVKSPEDIYIYAIIGQMANIGASIANIILFKCRYDIKIGLTFSKQIFKHLRYVLILFGNAVSMLIYVSSDITILGIIKDENEVGIYSVSVKIYTIVKQLLNAILIVGIPRMARWTGSKTKEVVGNQLNEILGKLFYFLFPSIIGILMLSNQIVNVMAGADYETASESLRILAVTLVFSTSVCFFSNLVLIPNNMEKSILTATLISAAVNVILNLLFIPRFGAIAAAFTTLMSEGITVVYMAIVVRKKYFPKVLPDLIKAIIVSIGVIISCYVVRSNINSDIWVIIISVATSFVVWGFLLLIFTFIEKVIRK